MNIIDITPEISKDLGVFPGDTQFQREVLLDTDKGDHFGLSKITTTLHLGAHVDAPNHYTPQEIGISERSLNYYYGPCQVITVSAQKGQRIQVSDLATDQIAAPRVLLKTGSFPEPNQWNNDFSSLSEELIDFLATKHVLLVGIDTPSIDPCEAKELKAHHKVAEHNMAILEGIVLSHVKDGEYLLSALPLKIKDADASPVRAVLISV